MLTSKTNLIDLRKARRYFPIYWLFLGLLMAAGDYLMGPFIQFPFLFILPVALAAWHSGRRWGFFLAVSLPLIRFYFTTTLWVVPWTLQEDITNAAIRISVLLILAYLIDRTARQTRTLAQEVRILRGILPICSFCKKIRNEDEKWEQLEAYITRHSEALFSHGLCPECAREQYGDYFKAGSLSGKDG